MLHGCSFFFFMSLMLSLLMQKITYLSKVRTTVNDSPMRISCHESLASILVLSLILWMKRKSYNNKNEKKMVDVAIRSPFCSATVSDLRKRKQKVFHSSLKI